jgi:hydrogenase maturation protein HypF
MLARGSILAIKGIGGYHLACRADDARSVVALRSRKHREDKPFALMAPNLAEARRLVELSEAEAALLEAPARPIVIARRRADAGVAAAVAPRSRDLGVMLPYTPLHHLLLADAGVTLVMTSGNVSEEPIAYRDEDALERLDGIADAFLLHDRPIHTRVDDSVLRSLSSAVSSAPLVIRRSRGMAPGVIGLPLACERPMLGCGAELKSTFCLAKGGRAWVGQHVGDLKNFETLRSYREGVEHLERLFAVAPAVVAHDLHPDYLATRYALEREGVERVGVQHHHAHLAACLAEHRESEAAVGAIFDGAGLGTDGTVWGGEILVGDLAECERAASLHPVPLPGGDTAVREPWRMACAWLVEALGEQAPALPASLRPEVPAEEWGAVCRLLAASGLTVPRTTSAGRLFDAVAALCGVRARVNHEGQAAAELEGLSSPAERSAYPLAVVEGAAGAAVLDPRETIRAVTRDLARGVGLELIGARFHNALAAAAATACEREAERNGLSTVVLSGGVFQNRLLLERTAAKLRSARIRVLIPQLLPPNDGGIAYGQVAVAAARVRGR